MRRNAGEWKVTRRHFLKASSVGIAALSVDMPSVHGEKTDRNPKLRFGVVTDAHYADVPARGSRHFRASLAKMTECVALMNDMKVDFLVQLGDFKDQGTPPLEVDTLKYLEAIEAVFRRFEGPRYHVLGNHDVDSISKEQFQSCIENTGIARDRTYFSFESKGVHFVVLDANFSSDGSAYSHGRFDWTDANLPREELAWLRKDLAGVAMPVIAFVHQPLDGNDSHTVRNASEVRQCLQECGRVLAVFQGHKHVGHYSRADNIHFYTLKAMVDGGGEKDNAYAVVDVYEDRNIVVTGYRKATSMELGKE